MPSLLTSPKRPQDRFSCLLVLKVMSDDEEDEVEDDERIMKLVSYSSKHTEERTGSSSVL